MRALRLKPPGDVFRENYFPGNSKKAVNITVQEAQNISILQIQDKEMSRHFTQLGAVNKNGIPWKIKRELDKLLGIFYGYIDI